MAGLIVIGDHNYQQHTVPPAGQGMGLIPRDYDAHPRGYYAGLRAVNFPTIPRAEWSERIKDKLKYKSQISDIMLAKNVPCLDQNGKGYCWAHSTTGCVQAARAIAGEPTVGLSAYAVACVIKNFRDEGGWGAQSADYIADKGVPSEEFWPQRSMSRSNDNPATWENAKLHRINGLWADMAVGQYDRNLSFEQYATCWLANYPTVDDHNWWGHSIMGCDLVDGVSLRAEMRNEDSGKMMTLAEFDAVWFSDPVTAGFGSRDRNSWGDSYGDRGFFTLAGSKAVPDGGVAIYGITSSPV